MGKVFICLDLEPFFLELSEGSWELDACHRLIGGLNNALSNVSFPRTYVVTLPNICSATVTAVTRLCQMPFVFASCECTGYIMPTVIVRWTCLASSFAFVSSWFVHGLTSLYLPWSAIRPRSIRFFCSGHPGA